ncbi:MAG: sugar phosphate isomerase/epimerase [Bacteroidia bacterium]|nr:sugar phosphate isomerase/epimerase [Bacteroidia bacterium]
MSLLTVAMTILLGVSSSLQHSTPEEWAAKHVALGLKCVNFPVDYLAGEDVYMAYKKAADEAVAMIQRVIDAVKPKHTKFAIESMPWMIPSGPDEYLRLIEAVDREEFGVHLDAVNMITSPQRYFFNDDFLRECFEKLGPRIISCHLKDINLKPQYTFQLQECAPGEGTLDIPLFLELASKYNPSMPFIIEHLTTDEQYVTSVKYVQELMEGK